MDLSEKISSIKEFRALTNTLLNDSLTFENRMSAIRRIREVRRVLTESVLRLPESPIDLQAHQAATSPLNDLPEPTQAQKEAGNYKKGRVSISGLELVIENPAQSTRSGVSLAGEAWSNLMHAHYGYVAGTKGADGDEVDIYIKPSTPLDWNGVVYVVNQVDPATGLFDEHKCMLGFDSEQEATANYLSNYDANWQGLGSVFPLAFEEFKELVFDSSGFVSEFDSASPIKSVTANIARGKLAMNNALTHKTSVHRAMYRNDIGWIDFVWGDEGAVRANGKTKGAMGLAHVLEARVRKDGMTEQSVIHMLTQIVPEALAKGTIYEEHGKNATILYGNHFIALAKTKGGNAWMVTAFEIHH